MPAGLRRYYSKGHFHFITFSCYRRLPLLKTARARDIFVKELGKLREEMGFQLLGYVVMPEHVHLLLSEPGKGTLSKVVQVVKQRVSRALRKKKRRSFRGQLRLPFSGERSAPKRFWQRRFYDFNVWSHGKRKEKLNYMHANPVTRKLVKHPKEWAWSSWSFYEKGQEGMISMDCVE